MDKEIYFNVLGIIDKVTITKKSTSNDLIDLIRSIGKVTETQFECIVHSPNGGILFDIDYYFLCENSLSDPYKVTILHRRSMQCPPGDNAQFENSISENLVIEENLQKYMVHVERKIEHCEQTIKQCISNLENRFLSLSSRVERFSLLSWMIPPKSHQTSTKCTARTQEYVQKALPSCSNPEAIIPPRVMLTSVLNEYKMLMCDYDFNYSLSADLKLSSFNNWLYSDAELMHLVRKMFIDLGLLTEFHISVSKFDRWIFEVYCGYNVVPFHNFKHAFMVTQMMYSLILAGNLMTRLSSLDVLILMTASICHDLNHPGFNNTYQINRGSELAALYNDQSPLENHHSAYCFNILSRSDCDILSHLNSEQLKSIRGGIIKCILATDMSRHNDILNGFKTVLPNFDWSCQSHRDLLMMILIKSSDISNEARSIDVASKWIDCLFEEFFCQSDHEKQLGLPVAPFMDRDKVTKPSSQCGFIRFVIYPLYESLSQLLLEYQEHLVCPVLHQLDYYSHLDNLTSGKPKSRKSIVETLAQSKFRRASHQCFKVNLHSITHIDQLKVIKTHNEIECPRKLST